MKPTLTSYLTCPVEGSPLSLDVKQVAGDEVMEGGLACSEGHQYAVARGVPRLVVPGTLPKAAEETEASFSAKWRRIPGFGFDEASRSFYNSWYLERYGFGSEENLRQFLWGRRHVLDAGTGLGRDVHLYARNTQGQVFGVDLSDSIDMAYQHVGQLPNVHLVQADLRALPFPDGFFDYIASEGVLHHTPSTEESFKCLVRHLAPHGQIAAYVYKKKGPIREFADDYLRAYYTKASPEECYEFARAMAALGKALWELQAEIEIPEDIPILGIRAGRYNVQRFLYYNVLKCYWNDALDYETNVMTNFDWYHPTYAHRHTPEEVRGWCEDQGLRIVSLDVGDSGISVRAERVPQPEDGF